MEKCLHENNDCIDSRQRQGYRYRRRVCKDCGAAFKTVEIEVDDSIPSKGPEAINRMLTHKYGITARQRKAIEAMIEAFLEVEK